MENKGKSISLSSAAATIVERVIEKIRSENPSRTKKVSPSEAVEVMGTAYLGDK